SSTLAGLQMNLDANGNIYLLWQDWPSQNAFVSVSNDGVSFSTPTTFQAGTQCGSGPCTRNPGIYPQLSVTPGGAITVGFFGTPSDPTAGPFSAVSVDGGATFTTVSVADSHIPQSRSLVNVTGPSGEQYVIWGGTDSQIHVSVSLDGG